MQNRPIEKKPCGLNTQSGETQEPGREAWGLGVCVVTLVARLPWLIRSASTPQGAAACLHSVGSALPALRRTVDLQQKRKSSVVLSCHLPRGSQRSVGAALNRAACAARSSQHGPGTSCLWAWCRGTHLTQLSQAWTEHSPLGGFSVCPTEGT